MYEETASPRRWQATYDYDDLVPFLVYLFNKFLVKQDVILKPYEKKKKFSYIYFQTHPNAD